MIVRFTGALILTALLSGRTVPAASPAASPPAFDAGGVMNLDLQTQLEKGLKARRPVEFQYIDEIIQLVEQGKLSRKLVVTTYLWAQQKPWRPLQHFQLALEARTRGLPVRLPNLNLQAVGISNNGGRHGVNTPPIPTDAIAQ